MTSLLARAQTGSPSPALPDHQERDAVNIQGRGHDAERVAHFVNRLVFCMFAEDVDLLPNKMFQRMLEASEHKPEQFEGMARALFSAMRAGGLVGFEQVEWFNGGLFDDGEALPLDKDDIKTVLEAARLDWAEIDPSIFGTLFDRGLDPDKRSQLGAHYTDRDKIMLIVEPVVVRPLVAEWEAVKVDMQALLDKAAQAKAPATRTKARKEAEARYRAFLDRLRIFRVLDPACGSGNFLYLALLALKDLEHRAGIEAEAMGLQREFPQIGPECVRGIEINPYAAELARISVWIGEIQWMKRNGFGVRRNPILRPLDTIENRDAVLNEDGTEAVWPQVNAIIGNPPFLGARSMKPELGEKYVERLRRCYAGVVGEGSDLVCFWFSKAWKALAAGRAEYAGLVATNSISGTANRGVIEPIAAARGLFEVWRDEPWTVEGAAVRVSIVCFSPGPEAAGRLDGNDVEQIHSDLRANHSDITVAHRLRENRAISFQGVVPRSSVKKAVAQVLGLPSASFALSGADARQMLVMPSNPNGEKNAKVIFPYLVWDDITARPSDRFIVDFGTRSEAAAALFEAPFAYIRPVKEHRAQMAQREALETWWQFWRNRPELKAATNHLSRFIITGRVSKHRTFVWATGPAVIDNAIVVIARDDDTTFGVLHSRFHEAWALRLCTWLGVGNDPRYTPSTTFETFPFPEGLTPDRPAADYEADPRAQAIAIAAQRLDSLRRNWLNPPDLVEVVPEVVPGFPDRLTPKDEAAAAILAKRTLTNLYNQRPQWLAMAHADLDAAVAAAYGWPADISEDEALARLLDLNHARSGEVPAQ